MNTPIASRVNSPSEIRRRIRALPSKPCHECGGCGTECDPSAIGALLRNEREIGRISLREVAKQMGYTPAYLSDLEHGRRAWRSELQDAFVAALQTL